jgi:hypothetical protein
MQHVISLVGFKGSGKDTAGRYLVDHFNYTPFSFAESLKDALAAILCWPRHMLEGDTAESRAWRESVDEWWAERLGIPHFTPRLAMQLFGTNVVREHFHQDTWINNIDRKLTLLQESAKAVLIDGRFPNELDLGTKHGSLRVRVKRGIEPDWWDMALVANGFPPEFDDDLLDTLRNELGFAMRIGCFDEFRGPNDPNAMKAFARHKMDEFGVHESEWAWIGQPVDVIIENDGTIEDLYAEIAKYAK